MIRKFLEKDIEEVIKIWFETNISSHSFIPKKYWIDNYNNVKSALPNSNLYIYEHNKKVCGFIGIDNGYIAGLFVEKSNQSKGIGKKLLNYCKSKYNKLSLKVYEKNKRAIDFYLKEQFKVIGKSTDHDNKETEYLMEWIKK